MCKLLLCFQASLRGKVSEFDAYVLMLHKNALQVLVPTIGQQLTLYLDSREKKKEEIKKKQQLTKGSEPMDIDETSVAEFEFNEKVCLQLVCCSWVLLDRLRIVPFFPIGIIKLVSSISF